MTAPESGASDESDSEGAPAPRTSLPQRLYDDGCRYMDAGRLDQAIAAFERSAELLPHHHTLALLGECLCSSGRLRDAVAPLETASRLSPLVKAPSLLAKVYLLLGDHSQAGHYASRVLETEPDNRMALEVRRALSR